MRPSEFDEWPETDRNEALALHYLEQQVCPCGCGNYIDEAHSRDWWWDVTHRKCYAGAALDQQRRQFDKDHKDDPTRHDGRLWSVVPVKPEKPKEA